MESENKKEQKPNGEIDRFSRLMFGNSNHRETYKEGENNPQEVPEQKEQSFFGIRSNDDWLFGSRRNEAETNKHTNQIENLLSNVDFELLMETIEMFVATTKQLKPIFNEITPFFHRFSKKFKSNEEAK